VYAAPCLRRHVLARLTGRPVEQDRHVMIVAKVVGKPFERVDARRQLARALGAH
jgi:hypothetical protein